MAAAVLVPILTSIGAPILKKLLADKLPSGVVKDVSEAVVDTIASKIGVPSTPEAIAEAFEKSPEVVKAAVQEAENEFRDLLDRDALFAREDSREHWFSWAWRPALSWTLLYLFIWNATIQPLLAVALKANLPAVPYDTLVAFAGIWLTIYGGGHTVKAVFGKA
jgi:Protein of unknown function (DUF3154).